jgi:hypothetical protein
MDAAARWIAGMIARPAGFVKTTSAEARRLCACLPNVNHATVTPTVAPSTTAAAEPRIATPSARWISPASTTCVCLVRTVSGSPARHWAAEPTAAPSATAVEEFLTAPRFARMATSAVRRTLVARAQVAGLRRPPRCPSRHRRALGPSQPRPRCRPSEHRGRPRWRHVRLPPRHPANLSVQSWIRFSCSRSRRMSTPASA